MKLRDLKQWLVWEDKAAPTSALTGKRQNWQNNLSTLTEAEEFCRQNPTYNLGFCFGPDSDYVGLDLDACVNPETGKISPWATVIMDTLEDYVAFHNYSVSGTGLKVVLKCSEEIARAVRHFEFAEQFGAHVPQAELFVDSKYFALTVKTILETDVEHVSKETLERVMATDLSPRIHTSLKASGSGEVPVSRIKDALKQLDIFDFQSRDKWFPILQGVHHGCGGSAEGLDVFKAWSKQDESSYDEGALERDWFSCDSSAPNARTFGSVLYHVEPEKRPEVTPTEMFPAVAIAEREPSPEGTSVLPEYIDRVNQNHSEVARLFIRERGINIKYVRIMQEWLVFDGVKWRFDKEGVHAKRAVQDFVRTLAGRVPDIPEQQQNVMAARIWLGRLGNNSQMDALLGAIKIHADVVVEPDDLDAKNHLFNCLNGTLDLETGEFREHRREDLITKCSATNYTPDQDCPIWERVIDDIFGGDKDLIRYVQRLAGYALSGEITEEKFPILFGHGCNGKSTFTQTLGKIFGEYTAYLPSEMLNQNKELHPTHIVELKGARLALMAELEANVSLAEATVKKICSQDMIQGHRMRRDPISFKPTHLSMLASNHKPDCKGTDNGIWRRLVLVPFTVNLEAKKDVTIPQQLVSEYGGILDWLLKGYRDFAENGLGTCDAVEDATLEYRTDEDNFRTLFEDAFEVVEGATLSGTLAYTVYQQEQGRLGKIKFYREMERIGYPRVQMRVAGVKDRYFKNLKAKQNGGL